MAETNTVKTWEGVIKNRLHAHEAKAKALRAAIEAGVIEFNRHKDTLLATLRDEYCRGLRSVPVDADRSAWLRLGLLAHQYLSEELMMREFRKPAWKRTSRQKRLRDIAKILERAQDMISEALKSEVGNELLYSWRLRTVSKHPPDDPWPTASELGDELGQMFAGLAIVATAARRAADKMSPARPGKPAILPRDCIRSLGDIYRDFTGQAPGTGTGPFYRFVMQFRAALDPSYKTTDGSGKREDGSLVDAIKLALGKRRERPKRRKQAKRRALLRYAGQEK